MPAWPWSGREPSVSVSLHDAKQYLGIASTDCQDDYRLSQIINAIRAQVDDYLATPLVQIVKTQRFDGATRLWILDAAPVVSVASIQDPAGNAIQSDRYAIVAELGQLHFYGYPGRAVRSDGSADRWIVTYTAGHFDHENKIPHSIRLAMLDLIARHYQRTEPDVQAQRTGPSSVSYIPNPTALEILPRRAQVLLSPYRRQLL